MVGLFTAEATIKSKHFRREQKNILMEEHIFWQRALTVKQLLHGAKGRETANAYPESAVGWVLIGWALGRSLKILRAPLCFLDIDVPIRGAQFAADRIAPIRSDSKSHDSNRNPKFRSIRCDVFTIFFQMFRFFFQIARFDSLAIRFASGS